MNEVKVFRVTGKIVKSNLKTTFQKEVRALKSQDAAEKIYMELGSKHRAKRFHIRISKIEEISLEEIEDPLVKELTRGEETNVE